MLITASVLSGPGYAAVRLARPAHGVPAPDPPESAADTVWTVLSAPFPEEGRVMPNTAHQVGFPVSDDMKTLALPGTAEVFGEANRQGGNHLLSVLSAAGEPLRTSIGRQVRPSPPLGRPGLCPWLAGPAFASGWQARSSPPGARRDAHLARGILERVARAGRLTAALERATEFVMPVGAGAALTLLAPEDHPAVALSAQMRGIVFTGILAPEPATVPSPGPADTAQAATTPAALLRADPRSLHSRGAGAASRTARLSAGATEHRGLPGRSGCRHVRGLRRFCSRRSGCCWSNGSAARLSAGSTLGGRRRPWSPAPPGRAAACFCSARWWACYRGLLGQGGRRRVRDISEARMRAVPLRAGRRRSCVVGGQGVGRFCSARGGGVVGRVARWARLSVGVAILGVSIVEVRSGGAVAVRVGGLRRRRGRGRPLGRRRRWICPGGSRRVWP